MVRYLARLARSTSAIDCRASGDRSTAVSSSRASARECLALTSESSDSSAASCGAGGTAVPVQPARATSDVRSPAGVAVGAIASGDASSSASSMMSSSMTSTSTTRGAAAPAAFDLLAQADEGQLPAGDLIGQASPLLRVLDLHQLVRVGERVFAQGHQGTDIVGRVRQAEPVLQVALVLAQLVGQLPDAVAVLADHPVEHRGFIERRDVLALEVLDDRDLERCVVVDLLDQAPGWTRGRPDATHASVVHRR